MRISGPNLNLFTTTQVNFHYSYFFIGPSGVATICIDCFLDILKSHQWNFIKLCKHNPIFKTNTYNENLRARGHVLAITVRGVSNKHCLLPFFH